MSAIIKHLNKLSEKFEDVFSKVGGVRKDGVTLLGVAEYETIDSISGQLEYKDCYEPDTRKPFYEKYGLSDMQGYIIKIDNYNPKLIEAKNISNEVEKLEKILTEKGYFQKAENEIIFRAKDNNYGTMLQIIRLDKDEREEELVEITQGAIIFADDTEAIKIIDYIIEYYAQK